jgi:hypothetical protein
VCTGQLGWSLRMKQSKQITLRFVRLHHQRNGFQILDAMQGDLDHVLGHEFDQQRDWANTPEDRALASRLGEILQDPVPGR